MRILLVLLRVKLRLLVRHITRKGKTAGLIFFLLYYPLFGWGSFEFARDGTHWLLSREPDWVLCAAVAVAYLAWLGLLFVSELQFSFVLNLAQRSTDNEFLFSLPVSFDAIVLTKSVERLCSDFTLPMAVGGALGFATGVRAGPLATTLVLVSVFATSLLAGMAMFLLHMVLSRRFSSHRIRQVSFLVQPLAMCPLLLFPLIGEGYIRPDDVMSALSSWRHALSWFPPFAFAHDLVNWSDGARFGCIGSMALLLAGYWLAKRTAVRMEQAGLAFLPEESRVQATGVGWPGRRRLKGFFWKDFRLLVRDQNLLGNALLVPLLLVAYWMIAMGAAIREIPSSACIAFLCFVFYFDSFGAMNAAGMEGLGIGLVRGMPISARRFLANKAIFWSLLSALLFIPLFLGTASWVSLDPSEIWRGLAWMTLGCPLFATLGVGLSAIFAQYDAKVLQQGSTIAGKGVFLVLWAPFLYLASTDDLAYQFRGVLLYTGLVTSIFLVAARTIESHDDPDAHPRGRLYVTDGLIFMIGFLLAWSPVMTFLNTVLGKISPGLAMSIAFFLVGPLTWRLCWNYLGRRTGNASEAMGLSRGRRRYSPIFALGGAIAYALWIEAFYRLVVWRFPHLAVHVTQAGELWQDSFSASWPSAVLVGLALFVLAPLVEETLFRGLLYTSLRQTGFSRPGSMLTSALLFALMHPPIDAVAVIPLGLALAWCFETTGSLASCLLLHSLANVAAVGRAFCHGG